MTNLRTDEIVFFLNLTKIGTDENKAIYSIYVLYLYVRHCVIFSKSIIM